MGTGARHKSDREFAVDSPPQLIFVLKKEAGPDAASSGMGDHQKTLDKLIPKKRSPPKKAQWREFLSA